MHIPGRSLWQRIVILQVLNMVAAIPVARAAPCTVSDSDALTDVITALDDGMGGTTALCLNAAGRHEIVLAGEITLDAPLLLDLGEAVELHGPAQLHPADNFQSCIGGICFGCAVVVQKWNHYVHHLTLANFPTGGICVEGSGHVISHVAVIQSQGDGIRLEGDNQAAVGNTVDGTHGDGIALYGATHLALQNTMSGYDHYGLGIYSPDLAPDVAAALLASNTILAGAADGRCSNWIPCVLHDSTSRATNPVSPNVDIERPELPPNAAVGANDPLPTFAPLSRADAAAGTDREAGCTLRPPRRAEQ